MEHFTLLLKEIELIGDSKTDHHLLGAACLLKYFQYEGRFPSQKQDIPPMVIVHLAQQLGVVPEKIFPTIGKDARSRCIVLPFAHFWGGVKVAVTSRNVEAEESQVPRSVSVFSFIPLCSLSLVRGWLKSLLPFWEQKEDEDR